jgi:hypothetical protein
MQIIYLNQNKGRYYARLAEKRLNLTSCILYMVFIYKYGGALRCVMWVENNCPFKE